MRASPVLQTHSYSALPEDLAAIAREGISGDIDPDPAMPCLTLLATAGDKPEWNDRMLSTGHRTIPLQSEEVVENAPMIARLLRELGMQAGALFQPDEDFLLEAEQRTFNVFLIRQALGSPYVPAQNFVKEYEISSIMGFGGLFPEGEFFAFLLFTRISIAPEIADMFRTIALSAKLALLPFIRGQIFENDPKVEFEPVTLEIERERLRAEAATLGLLIPELESVALRRTKTLNSKVAKLSEEVTRDVLTGLSNRRAFNEALEREFDAATKNGSSVAIMMLDIDSFKSYNDRFGHQGGDEALKQVGNALAGSVRHSTDLVARYGGEEFVVLMREVGVAAAVRRAEAVRTAIFDLAIEHPDTEWGRITVSIGCAALVPTLTDSPLELLRLADEKLYEAKRAGRNRVLPLDE